MRKGIDLRLRKLYTHIIAYENVSYEGGEKMDKALLRYYTNKHGYTMQDLSRSLNISEVTLYRKLNGTSDFTRPEIQRIKDVLGLDDSVIISIFFS